MTPILEVITNYCAPLIKDVRLQEMAADNKPQYAWTMWNYLRPQMSKFTHPYEITDYLFGSKENPNLIEPNFDSARHTLSNEITADYEVDLGADFIGFELFSAHIISVKGQNVISTSATAICNYDSTTGIVTIKATPEQPIAKGTTLDFDFYTDGHFVNDLSDDIMGILGICFEYGWWVAFENDWLSYVPKVEDKSFFEQNRANRMNAGTSRCDQILRKLAGAQREYDTKLHAKAVLTPNNRLKF